MRNINGYLGAAAAALGLASAQPALASSHREAPAISMDPAADNTDLWAWSSHDHSKLYVVAAWNPLEEPSGGPNFNKFADDVLYQIHITPTGNSVADKIVYQIRFHTSPIARTPLSSLGDKGHPPPLLGGHNFFSQLSGQTQTYSVVKITYGDTPSITPLVVNAKVAPPNIGPRTDAAAYANGGYTDAFAKTFLTDMGDGGSEGQVWAGPRDDGFYVDLGGVFDLATLRKQGEAQDGVYHYNCHAIALAIPTNLLTDDGGAPKKGNAGTVGVWASASRRQVTILHRSGDNTEIGPWVQVSRQGLPLINEAVIGLQDKDKYNRTYPTTDVTNFGAYFLSPTIVKDAEVVKIYSDLLKLNADDYKYGRTDIIDAINLKGSGHDVPLMGGTGDVLRVDMATDSAFPNGRPLGPSYNGGNAYVENDVTDIILSLFLTKLTKPVSDGVQYNDAKYLDEMPFLALPWRGLDQGHGKPTPAK